MAMNSELAAIVSYIERERGVEREDVLTAIEGAIKQAASHNPGVTNDLRVVINRKDLSLHVYDTMVVSNEETGTGFISLARARRIKPDAVEGEAIEIEMPAARLGRIAAQTSRQMIMQKIRDIERTNVYTDFKNRIGEIVSGTVSAVNRRDLYVFVGKTEMLLPGKERIPTEEFAVGDSIRAIVHSVKPDANGPAVTLSRASAEFVRTLFRLEVGEISDGVVEIMGIARDPGYRTKLAVRTLDEKVDPVGACVGLKGARVRNIVRELNGEKIDIVRWNADIKHYVAQALAPAKLESVEVDPDGGNTVHARDRQARAERAPHLEAHGLARGRDEGDRAGELRGPEGGGDQDAGGHVLRLDGHRDEACGRGLPDGRGHRRERRGRVCRGDGPRRGHRQGTLRGGPGRRRAHGRHGVRAGGGRGVS